MTAPKGTVHARDAARQAADEAVFAEIRAKAEARQAKTASLREQRLAAEAKASAAPAASTKRKKASRG